MHRASQAAAAALLATVVGGCGGSQVPHTRTHADHVRDLSLEVPDWRIVDPRTGEDAGFEAMVDDLARVRVAYVGEAHDAATDHAMQLAIVRALHAREPSLAIGLEMVQRPRQGVLDDWVAGRIGRATLLQRLEWNDSWGFEFNLYAPIFDFAREHRVPMVALNAPRELTRAVAQGGLESLSPEQRRALPELDLGNARHRELVEQALKGHPHMEPDMLERFYAAQVIWDETMARSVARFMEKPDAPQRMVVLAGNMHVREGLGIPERAARRGAEPYRVVMTVEPQDLDAGPAPADWLWRLPARASRPLGPSARR